MKDWKDLTISDDYMFKLIIKRKRICTSRLKICPMSARRRYSFPFTGARASAWMST